MRSLTRAVASRRKTWKTKFYKGSNSVRGSGIGLALVDSIMTALDGTLDIKSTLGRGTVVTLGLPLYQK